MKILKLLSEGTTKRQICILVRVYQRTFTKYEGIFVNHPYSYGELLNLTGKEFSQIVAFHVVENPQTKALSALFLKLIVQSQFQEMCHFFWTSIVSIVLLSSF